MLKRLAVFLSLCHWRGGASCSLTLLAEDLPGYGFFGKFLLEYAQLASRALQTFFPLLFFRSYLW